MTGRTGTAVIARAYGEGAARYASVLDPFFALLVAETIRAAGISPGQRVLDLATGTGVIARAASERGASVLGVDFSQGMLALARRLSPPGVHYLAADASALPVQSGGVAAVTCGLALSHLTDITGALSEMRRALRPGGAMAATAWGTPMVNPAASVVLDVLRGYAGQAGQAAHPFMALLDEQTWGSEEAGCAALRQAGFETVRFTKLRLVGSFANPEEAVDWVFAWPSYGMTLGLFEAPVRAAVEADSREAVRRDGRLAWDFTFNLFVVTNPER